MVETPPIGDISSMSHETSFHHIFEEIKQRSIKMNINNGNDENTPPIQPYKLRDDKRVDSIMLFLEIKKRMEDSN